MSVMKQSPLSCPGHTRPVVDIYFSGILGGEPVFITAAKDGKAILRNGNTGDWIGTFVGHKGAVWSCILDQNATKAATGAADFTAKIWDATTGSELLSITQDHIIRCVDFSKTDSGARLLTANNWKKISLYDLAMPEKALTVLEGHGQIIRRILWCNGDRNVLSISEDKTIRLWDLSVSNRTPVSSQTMWTKVLDGSINDLQFRFPFSDDGLGQVEAVMACGKSLHMCLFDWRNPQQLTHPISFEPSYNLPCFVHTVSLHATEKLILCGGDDHMIYRLNSESGEIMETCKGHFGPLHCVRFSPNGHVFASGSEDGTVRLWQTVVGHEFGLWKLTSPPNESGNQMIVDDATTVSVT